MNELDGLRDVLSRRADLAPDPDTVLPAVHRKIRRRRARRRAGGILGAVAVTVAGLTTTSLLLHARPATNPMTTAHLVGRPTMPFSVSHPPAGFREVSWAFDAGVWTADFQAGHGSIVEIQLGGDDPEGGMTVASHVLVDGQRVPFGYLDDKPVLSWTVSGHSPTTPVTATGQDRSVSRDLLVAFAQAVQTSRPSTPRSMLRLSQVPDHWDIRTWAAQWNSLPDETAVLCPPDAPPYDSDTCVRITVGTAPAAGQQPPTSAPDTTRYQVRWQVGTHWVAASSVAADPELVRTLADGVRIG